MVDGPWPHAVIRGILQWCDVVTKAVRCPHVVRGINGVKRGRICRCYSAGGIAGAILYRTGIAGVCIKNIVQAHRQKVVVALLFVCAIDGHHEACSHAVQKAIWAPRATGGFMLFSSLQAAMRESVAAARRCLGVERARVRVGNFHRCTAGSLGPDTERFRSAAVASVLSYP